MDEIKNITSEDEGKTFEVPESRIGSAADARSIIAGLQQAEQTRSGRRAKINGLLNGNRPWSPTLLQSKGQGERTNLNLREAEGFVAAAKTPYFDLVFEVDRYAQFTLDYGDDQTRQEEWGDKIGARYHYALDDWDGMNANFQRSQYQMIVHGAGPMVWEDARDWRSKSKMAGQILVPDDASADVEEWETAGVPRSYLPSELWRKIQDESVASAAKWNVPAVKKAIMNAATEETRKAFGDTWESYEAEIRKGSADFDNKSKRIFAVALFQKEFTGKISHFIVLDTGVANEPNETTGTDQKADEDAGFLYRKIGRFECFTQIVNGFLYDVGPDGQWHSVKGAGPKIFDFCEVSNRLTCRNIDGAIASSGLIFQAKTANALQNAAMTMIGGGVVVGPDYELQQNRMSADLQSPLLVKRDLFFTLERNTGQYQKRFDKENHAPTLGQAQLDASQQAVLGKGDVNRYYRSLDRWHRETFRRLLAMGEKLYQRRKDVAPDAEKEERQLTPSERGALDFYRDCIETDGIPEEALKFENFCRIKATRSIGYGSAQMRLMISESLIQMLPTMDERARNTALRMRASALGGQTVADLLFPRYDIPQIVDSHMSLATLENNFLRLPGGKIRVDPSQDNVTHFQVHLQDVAAHAQEVREGGDPMALMVHLEQAGPHLHEHLFAIQGDPTRKAEVKEMMEAWLAMSKMADQLKQQLEEAAAAAEKDQPPQAPDPKLIAALAKVNGELEIKRMATMGKLQLQAEKQRQQMRMKDVTTAHGMRLENMKIAPAMAA